MKELKVIDFYRKWLKLRETIDERDLDLFYEVVDIDGTMGRRMQLFKRGVEVHGNNDNPRFLIHWFPSGRCHANVILPLWLLNKKSLQGKYSIITNSLHSAIINTETYEIYDPTYTGTCSPQTTLNQFSSEYEIQNILVHALNLGNGIEERFMDFLSEYEKKIAFKTIQDHVEITKHKAVS